MIQYVQVFYSMVNCGSLEKKKKLNEVSRVKKCIYIKTLRILSDSIEYFLSLFVSCLFQQAARYTSKEYYSKWFNLLS